MHHTRSDKTHRPDDAFIQADTDSQWSKLPEMFYLQKLVLFFLTGAVAFAAGCRSISISTDNYEQQPPLAGMSQSNALMARALANYATGVLREGQQDSGAVTNYLRAIEFKPKLTSLYLRVAVQYLKRGANDQAIAVMEEACRSNPKSMESVFLLSQIYQIVNRPEEAGRAARKAVALEPKNNKGYIQLAALSIAAKDEQTAILVLRQALDKVSDPLPVLRLLGDLYHQHINSLAAGPGDINEAIKYYKRAVEFPTDDLSLDYLQKLGDLYVVTKQINKAITCFQKVAIHEPDNLQVKQKIALCYVALGDKEKALGLLKAIAGQDPQSPDIYYYLGDLYDSLGDKENAIKNFKAAHDADPSNPKSYLKLAFIHLRDNPLKAQEVIQDGLKSIPRERLFLEILAQIYLRNHQYNEALALFIQTQSSLPPDDPMLRDARFYVNYGIATQQCRLIEQAMSLYLKALEIDPDLLDTRVRLAILHVWQQDKDEAFSLMEDAICADPDKVAPWFFYAVISTRAGEYTQAVAAYGIAEKKAEKLSDHGASILDSAFYYNYAAAAERSGDYATAENLFTRAILLDPENSDAFNYMAYMWAEKGIFLDNALDFVGHALEFEPDNAAYLDTLGWIYFKQGKYTEALELIRNARAVMPDDPTILDHLGDALAGLGYDEQALEAWKKSFQIDGNSALEKKLRARGIDVQQLRLKTRPLNQPPPAVDE